MTNPSTVSPLFRNFAWLKKIQPEVVTLKKGQESYTTTDKKRRTSMILGNNGGN